MTMKNTAADRKPKLAKLTEQALREFVSGLPDDVQKTVAGSFQRLLASDVANDAIRVSDTALDFTLHNARGGLLQLSDVLKQGPVVLSFYRGGLCPFCNLEFKTLRERLPEIKPWARHWSGSRPRRRIIHYQPSKNSSK